jgi:predicted acyl esterase
MDMGAGLRVRTGLVIGALGAAVAASSSIAAPAPFGHRCVAQNGVRLCPTRTLDERVASFDGTPLDVDVRLPPRGSGPWPLVVFLHGASCDKTEFQPDSPCSAGDHDVYHGNDVFYARRGYAAVTATARGFGRSCGDPSSRTTACARGWMHLDDQRFEARDVQTLIGLLVDEGVARPGAVGVMGSSYGSGTAIELAFLRDRVRLRDGRLARWRSPRGVPLAITAAYPQIGFFDLPAAIAPNGRFRDTSAPNPGLSRAPVGVVLESYVGALCAAFHSAVYTAAPGVDPTADFSTWCAQALAGPRDMRAMLEEFASFHDAVGISGRPAALLVENGWTDGIFPTDQALRLYLTARARDRRAPVTLMLGDLGHNAGANKIGTTHEFNDTGARFFDAWLRHRGARPAPGSVTAYTQTCPTAAPAEGPFTAPSWAAMHTGVVRFGSPRSQTVSLAGYDLATGVAIDPLVSASPPLTGTANACASVPADDRDGTATARISSTGFMLMGSPAVTAEIGTPGAGGQLAARLWDVLPDGTQRLVSRGVYRLTGDPSGSVRFQLHANAYRFAAGHGIKLELLRADAPYYQADVDPTPVQIESIRVVLPRR